MAEGTNTSHRSQGGTQRPLTELSVVQDAVEALASAPVAIQASPNDALGLVLAEAVRAQVDVPPFANAAMDGFALRARDTQAAPVVLPVISAVYAGAPGHGELASGQAMRIMTGAPVPQGADAVVMVERTEERGADGVEVLERATPGQHVRPRGDDITKGSVVVAAGTLVNPATLGVLASVGCRQVTVYRHPVVGVLSTGDEVRDVGWAPGEGEHQPPSPGAGTGGSELGPAQIWDANRPLVLASLAAIGCQPVDLGVVGDDQEVIAERLVGGLERCDAVVTTGGASLGDFDWARAVLDRLSGGSFRWVEVAIKPAKPLAFGKVATKPVLCLPGNPVSSLVSFELFARPLLRQMAGERPGRQVPLAALADVPFPRKADGKLHLVRVVVTTDASGTLRARPAGAQGSHQLAATARASALALVPNGPGLAAGDPLGLLVLAGAGPLAVPAAPPEDRGGSPAQR